MQPEQTTQSVRTVGVEEEYLLVTPEGGTASVSPAVLRHAHLSRAAQGASERDDRPGGDVEKEFKQEQIEISTHPHESLAELLEDLRGRRRQADEAAQRAGARIAALGTSPHKVRPTTLPDRRAHEIRAHFGYTAGEQLTCGCHVHVSIADEHDGIRIVDTLRPWAPVLMALSANSPSWQGRSTSYASYRSQVWGRWPTAGPTAPFETPEEYHRVVEELLATGTILDDGMIYFDARLSARYPTVEVRVADVCLDAADAVLQAALVRGLADSPAIDQPRTELLRAASWRAGKDGVTGALVHPLTWKPAPAAEVVGALVEHARPTLERLGDAELVDRLVADVLLRGTGAVQQQSWRAQGATDDEVVRRATAVTVR